jgi:hypothetical protein
VAACNNIIVIFIYVIQFLIVCLSKYENVYFNAETISCALSSVNSNLSLRIFVSVHVCQNMNDAFRITRRFVRAYSSATAD